MAREEHRTEDAIFPHPLDPYPKLIINAALTGVIPDKNQNPHVPISAEEIIDDAEKCRDAGASIVHVHARDEQSRPTYSKDLFGEIIGGIRDRCKDLIICATTSGRRYGELEERSAVLNLEGRLKPDMASLTTGSLNFPDGPSVNTPEMIEALAQRMCDRGIKPELEILEFGMINTAKLLIKKDLAAPPYSFNLLLGSMHTTPATVANLAAMVQNLPPHSYWAACGIGKFQLKINTAAILMGGHVRIGLEDNLHYDLGRKRLATNVELIERVVRVAGELEREIASPAETRQMLGLI